MAEEPVPCANCLAADTGSSKSLLKNSSSVTLRAALFHIYGISFPFPESADQDNLILCKNCNDLLFQLHVTFGHFRDLARSTSWIGAAHQDLANARNVKSEVSEDDHQQDQAPPPSSTYMVQDASCQYSDPESEDDLDLNYGKERSPFTGALRALASQYKVPLDTEPMDTSVASPQVQLRASDVYDSGSEGEGAPFDNWVPPTKIFEEQEHKTDSGAEARPRVVVPPHGAKRGGGRGRPRGSKNKVSREPYNSNSRVIDSGDWIARRSERLPTLKIENAYSLTGEQDPLVSDDDYEPLKRKPGRPKKNKSESSAGSENRRIVTISPNYSNGIKAESGVAKRPRGRPYKSATSTPRLSSETLRIDSNGGYDPDGGWRRPMNVSIVPSAEHREVTVKSRPVSPHRNGWGATGQKRGPGRPRKGESSPSQSPKITRTAPNPDEKKRERPKVGPGRPGPGGSLGNPNADKTFLRCKECGESFRGYGAVLQHIKEAHPIKRPPPVRCPTCNKSFFSNASMTTHYNIMHGGGGVSSDASLKKFACTQPGCTKTFLYGASLLAHEATHVTQSTHTPEAQSGDEAKPTAPPPTVVPVPRDLKTQRCPVCDKEFYTENYLKLHMRDFHKIQPGNQEAKKELPSPFTNALLI